MTSQEQEEHIYKQRVRGVLCDINVRLTVVKEEIGLTCWKAAIEFERQRVLEKARAYKSDQVGNSDYNQGLIDGQLGLFKALGIGELK